MNRQALIFTPEQINEINKELKTVGDWKDQLSYTIFRNNQERFKKLCGFSVSSNEVITEEELAYFEETSKEPEEESNPQRFSMLNQMFMKTLQA